MVSLTGLLYPMTAAPHPYSTLTPEVVLDACEQAGFRGDGRLLTLNSYENRVYQVYMEEGAPVVAKFYRPERWSDAQIDEEHAFAHELAAQEIPVVAPLKSGHHQGFRFAVYPRRGGRTPELDDKKILEWIGRFPTAESLADVCGCRLPPPVTR